MEQKEQEEEEDKEQKPIQIKVDSERNVKVVEKPDIKEIRFRIGDIFTVLTLIVATVGLFLAGATYGQGEICEEVGGLGLQGNLMWFWTQDCVFEDDLNYTNTGYNLSQPIDFQEV